MKMTKTDWLVLLIPILLLALAIPFLPEQVPMQWGRDGNVTWTLNRYFFPLVGILPYIVYRSIKSKSAKK